MTEPTDAEILDAADDFRSQYMHGGITFDEFDSIGFARAVLAKWGTPPAVARTETIELRRMLCVAHAGALAYMDDGEASDSRMHPTIDFLRDSPKDIQRKIWERNRAALAGTAPAQPVEEPAKGTAYAALPEPLEIDWPELHIQALECRIEDHGLRNRYECAEYGWQDGVDKCAERVPEQIFDADQMRAFADATHALRVESLAAAYCEELDKLSQRNYELLHASRGQAPKCKGSAGECDFNGACMYACGQAPAGAVPLTAYQIHEAIKAFKDSENLMGVNHIHVARAIERAHGIGIKGGQHGDSTE